MILKMSIWVVLGGLDEVIEILLFYVVNSNVLKAYTSMKSAWDITMLNLLSNALKISPLNSYVINCRNKIQEFLLSDDDAES